LSVIGAALPVGLPLPFAWLLAVWPFVASTLSASPEAVSGASRPIVAVADAVGRSGSAWSGSTWAVGPSSGWIAVASLAWLFAASLAVVAGCSDAGAAGAGAEKPLPNDPKPGASSTIAERSIRPS